MLRSAKPPERKADFERHNLLNEAVHVSIELGLSKVALRAWSHTDVND